MTNILLTGETGFLGSLLKTSLGSFPSVFVNNLRKRDGGQRIDIRQKFVISRDINVDAVVHAAGKAHSVPKSDAEKQEFYKVNFEGTKNLCNALERLDKLPKSFIFISTVAVYGMGEGQQITEDRPLKGETPYAKSKILAEEWLQEWATKHSVILGILRLPLLVGPSPPGNLDAMIKGIRKGKYLSIGKANARKSMVWAEDIATIIPVLAEKGGIYNLTDGYHPSFGELEEVIAQGLVRRRPPDVPYWFARLLGLAGDILGRRFPINSDKLKKMTSTLTFDDGKARKELGWNPSKVLERLPEIFTQ